MTRKEERLLAIQNIGVSACAGGAILTCAAANTITLILCFGIMAIGFIDAYVCEKLLDKLKKNKGPQACKH